MSLPTAPPPLLRDYYALIPHPQAAQVLLLQQATGWSLPHCRTADRELLGGAPFCRHLRAQLGITATQLRVATVYVDPADGRWRWAMIALENHSPAWTPPPDAHWVDRATVAYLPLTQPEQRATILDWLIEIKTGVVPTLRSPWARPGWWAAIHSWVADALTQQGRALIGPLEQRKTWSVSCLLRGRTAAGAVYVKAAPALPLFANESAITAHLGAMYPAWVPTPLALDAGRRWMLLEDFGDDLLYTADAGAWEATVDAVAALQVQSVGHVDSLLAAGCLDRRLDRLAAQIPFLLEQTHVFAGLEPTELATLEAAAPQLAAYCAQLARSGVPPALLHGDLHDHNITMRAGQPLIFDWSDACIAHPFFDLTTLLSTDYLDAHPAVQTALRDRYLAHWAAYGSPVQLQRIADLAALVGTLHHAVSYAAGVSNVEPPVVWEWNVGLTMFVRQLLQLLAAAAASSSPARVV